MPTAGLKEWVYKTRGEITATLGVINFLVVFALFLSQLGVFGFGTRISTCETRAAEFDSRIIAITTRQETFERETRTQINQLLVQYPQIEKGLGTITDRLDRLDWPRQDGRAGR